VTKDELALLLDRMVRIIVNPSQRVIENSLGSGKLREDTRDRDGDWNAAAAVIPSVSEESPAQHPGFLAVFAARNDSGWSRHALDLPCIEVVVHPAHFYGVIRGRGADLADDARDVRADGEVEFVALHSRDGIDRGLDRGDQ